MPQTKFPVCPSLNRHRGNIYVVRTPTAPNFNLSLKINLCDLRDLCVSQFPRSGGEGWSLPLRFRRSMATPVFRGQAFRSQVNARIDVP
jgi:hypothetical protein